MGKQYRLLFFLLIMSCPFCGAQEIVNVLYRHSVVTNSIKCNWYIQFGVDMSLQNPYGKNFSEVFPNGKTYGINMAVGKWFSPELGIRLRLNWDNWFLENNHLSWVAPFGRNGDNFSRGGFGELVYEAHFNLNNIFCGYNENRFWSMSVFPRAGLVSNFAIGSCSPLIGGGIQNVWKLNRMLKVFFDVAYQMTTSEFVNCETNTGVGTGSNGFFNLDFGIQIDIGWNGFYRVSKL